MLYRNNRHSICYYFVFTPLILISSIFLFYNLHFTHDVITIYGQENEKINISKVYEVTIPKGSANPSVDITNLEERKWYIPPKLEINSGNIVKWTNNDVESHTVTSGVGSGIMSLLSNELGKANGIFDSGLFGPGKSWSYNFTNKVGLFTYFCTIHPWMTGSVQVSEQPVKHDGMLKNIPDYPVDGVGNKLSRFPVHTLTNDEKYDIDMGWSPKVLKTHDPVTFLIDFFEMPSNRKSHLLPFDFVIIQNNKTLERTSGISQVGAATLQYTFSEPGPVTIRIENVGNNPSHTIFDTIVYQNPNIASSSLASGDAEMQHGGIISPVGEYSTGLISTIFLVQLTYAIIFAIPAALVVIILLYKKGII